LVCTMSVTFEYKRFICSRRCQKRTFITITLMFFFICESNISCILAGVLLAAVNNRVQLQKTYYASSFCTLKCNYDVRHIKGTIAVLADLTRVLTTVWCIHRLWRVTANMFSKQLRIPDKGCYQLGAYQLTSKEQHVAKCYT
jgi:hypothetical protein